MYCYNAYCVFVLWRYCIQLSNKLNTDYWKLRVPRRSATQTEGRKKAKEAEQEIATMERWYMWRRKAWRGNPRPVKWTEVSSPQCCSNQKLLISNSWSLHFHSHFSTPFFSPKVSNFYLGGRAGVTLQPTVKKTKKKTRYKIVSMMSKQIKCPYKNTSVPKKTNIRNSESRHISCNQTFTLINVFASSKPAYS